MIGHIEAVLHAARDLAAAIHDLAIGRQRRQYRYDIVIDAPKDMVKRLAIAPDVTFEKANLRIVAEPLAGHEGVETGRVVVAGRSYPHVAYRRTALAPDTFLYRYLPELSDYDAQIGLDDIYKVSLQALPDGRTRMCLQRTLTHRRPGTRVSVPMGMRTLARMLKVQAEQEAGHAPARARRLGHPIWLLAAIASFWWLFGWRDAAILILATVLHELGHAVAMAVTGRGVRLMTLVPFFGGVASPKHPYDNEWQRAFVALMGPALSLVPTLALVWLAWSTDSALAAHAAFLFAVVNSVNLLPLVPLDGGVILDTLLRSLHARLGRAIAWLGVVVGLGFALWAQSVLIGLVFAFGALQLVLQSSFDAHIHLKRLGALQAAALVAALPLTILAYWTIVVQSDPAARGRAGLDAPPALAQRSDRR